jgi:hypothetical protein
MVQEAIGFEHRDLVLFLQPANSASDQSGFPDILLHLDFTMIRDVPYRIAEVR